MTDHAIIYVPSDTPEAMALAPRKVAGVPLIVRGIMTLKSAGIDACTLIIAASQRERIVKFLGRYREDRIPDVHIVTYEETYRISPEMIDEIAGHIGQRVLLINANLLFDAKLIETIYRHNPDDNRLFVCREGVHPLPILEITKKAWVGLTQFTMAGPHSIDGCIEHLLKTYAQREIQKPPHINCFLLKRREDVPVAEKFLAESIRLATNGFVAMHINKRISLPTAMVLAKLWISPHAVTSLNIVIGLLSGVFLAGKGYYSLLVGASLFQLASIADGVDGEIAKLTFRTSKFGQYIDTISDNLALASLLIGLTIGSYRTLETPIVFAAGAVAIAGVGAIIGLMLRFLRRHTDSASLVTFDREYLQKRSSSENPVITGFLRYGKHFAKKDIFSFMVFMFALSGVLPYWIFFVALGGVTGTVALVYLNVSDALRAGVHRGSASLRSKITKMVVFDFDGTLVNSMDAFADIAARVMPKHFDITAEQARASYLQTSGIPFFQQLETLFPGHPAIAQASAEFESIKKKSYFDRPVFHDAARALEELRRRNIKVAVSSNNFQDLVEQYVDRKGLAFDVVLGYRENFAKGEDHFRHLETICGIERGEMTFVGDSIKDGERAASAGVSFIGRTGIFTQEDFRRHFPDAPVVADLEHLKDLL